MRTTETITTITCDMRGCDEDRKQQSRDREMNYELNEALCNATLRTEKIIYLAGCLVDDESIPDELKDFFDEDTSILERCFEGKRTFFEWDGLPNYSDLIYWMVESGLRGFLVQFATPVMSFDKGTDIAAYSWGYYYTHWVYADTLEEAMKKGFKWAEEKRKMEKKQ